MGKKLAISAKNKKTTLFGLALLLLTASLPLGVFAQGGGSLGLVLKPEQGVPGMTVSVTLDIPSYLASRGLDAGYVELYKGLSYALVWDLGGTTDPPTLDTVRTSNWTIISYAHIDSEGMLEGAMTIPANATPGDHLITAVYYLQSSEAPLNYWWGEFTVVSESTALLSLPDWLLYVVIVIIGIVVALAVILFLRRRGRVRPL